MTSLNYGKPTIEFGTNGDHACDGGWINVTVPVSVDGAPYGNAMIGAWVWTTTDGHISQHAHDRVTRTGLYIEPYRGNDRHWEYANEVVLDLDELFPDADDSEEAMLDAAAEAAEVDYEEAFADVLREEIDREMPDAYVHRLIEVARALTR